MAARGSLAGEIGPLEGSPGLPGEVWAVLLSAGGELIFTGVDDADAAAAALRRLTLASRVVRCKFPAGGGAAVAPTAGSGAALPVVEVSVPAPKLHATPLVFRASLGSACR